MLGTAGRLLHTCQHEDEELSGVFLAAAGIRQPRTLAGICGAPRYAQVGRIVEHLEATAEARMVWRASNFPDCGSFRILSWKGPMNCQENTRRIPRSSAMKPPAWWWRRHGPSLTSPVSLG